MTTVSYLIIGSLALLSFVLLMRLFMLRYQLYLIRKQLSFLAGAQTNLLLTSQIRFRETQALLLDINQVLQRERALTLQINKLNLNFKETITSISHDIRTPLTSAIGYLQMMERQNLTQDAQREYLLIIEKRIRAVQRMLDQLFEYARLESGELQFQEETINVSNLLRDTLGMFYNDFLEKDTEPSITIPEEAVLLMGDRAALKRIFENIMHNALVHGTGSYGVHMETATDQCRIIFSNQTDSIEEDDIDRIFERFFTTDKSRTKKSTGLGLSIAKKLTEEMKGSIGAFLTGDIFSIQLTFPIIASHGK